MKIYLVDGTYELFRNYFGAPPKKAPDGREVGATLGLLKSLLMLLARPGATHVAVAFDHVIESFRNDLFPGYKNGEGVDAKLQDIDQTGNSCNPAMGVVVKITDNREPLMICRVFDNRFKPRTLFSRQNGEYNHFIVQGNRLCMAFNEDP